MRPTVYNRLLLVLGYAGVFVAGVLSIAALYEKDVPCGPSKGCAIVAADPSSHLLFNIPNAYFGLLGYIILAGLATFRELTGVGSPAGKVSVYIGYAAAAIGTLVSVYLTFISITQIHATCLWCLTSAVIMTLTLLTYMMLGSDIDRASTEPPKDRASLVLPPVLLAISLVGIGIMYKGMGNANAVIVDSTKLEANNLFGADAHILNPQGTLSIVEFGDLACPSCKHLFPQVEQLVQNSNGKVRYVFHHFPLYMNPEHASALPGAVVAEMAGESRQFWKFLELVYESNPDPNAPEPTAEDMIRFGGQLGLKDDDMRTRMVNKDDPARKRVQNDLDLAKAYNVGHTPTFIIIAKGLPTVQVSGGDLFKVLDEPDYKKLLGGP